MLLLSLPRQIDLLLSLSKTLLLFVTETVVTEMTTDTTLVVLALLVLLGDRMAAAMALIVGADIEIVIDGDSIVKDKALALPETLLLRYVFEVF